jgi:hypothetical protein
VSILGQKQEERYDLKIWRLFCSANCLLAVHLKTPSVTHTTERPMIAMMMKNKLEGMWKEAVVL